MKKFITSLLLILLATPALVAQQLPSNILHHDPNVELISDVLKLINKNYRVAVDEGALCEQAVAALLQQLDPHCVYVPAEEVAEQNRKLKGSFEGIGVSFLVLDDTICITDIIPQSGAAEAGIRLGDRILYIDGIPATGDSIDGRWARSHIAAAKKNKPIALTILRSGEQRSLELKRGKVASTAVDRCFMANDSIGYIRLTHFSRPSVLELREAIRDLQRQGMTALMLDLRGNDGGYFDAACTMASEFLPKSSLVVTTIGRNDMNGVAYVAAPRGNFKSGRLAVLIDENTASAAEVLSGAIQDWDRGVIVGRRSFGKGMVSSVYNLENGAQILLSTSEYMTPSGRKIQKPYADGPAAYQEEVEHRYLTGEMFCRDSIKLDKSKAYKSLVEGRTIYGGGGIVPDIFVSKDTTLSLIPYMILMRDWSLRWANAHRQEYQKMDAHDFLRQVGSLDLLDQFLAYAYSQGVAIQDPKDRYVINVELEANIVKYLYGSRFFYQVAKEIDNEYLSALRYLEVNTEE